MRSICKQLGSLLLVFALGACQLKPADKVATSEAKAKTTETTAITATTELAATEASKSTETSEIASPEKVTDPKLQAYLAAGEEHKLTLDNKDGTFAVAVKELKIKLVLPKGWKLKQQKYKAGSEKVAGLAMDGTGRHEVYDTDGNLVWAFSYLPYEDYPGEENNLQAIYNQVALGNNYHFVVRQEDKANGGDKLEILEDTDDKQVVYCVHYNGFEQKEANRLKPGALVRFKQEHLYIAIYGDAKLGEKQIREFAQSIEQQ